MKKALVCLAVIGIIILAIGLRIWGIGWGLPTASHYYSYHPDENVVLGASRNIDLFNGQFDPKFYNYGSLYIYIVNIAVVTGAVSGYINLDTKDSASVIAGLSHMYLAGRLAALLLGVLTVYLVFLLGRRASGDRRVGLLAALLFAIVPLHVMHSKFLAVDVPATFFVTLTLIFALRIYQEGHRLRDYVLAGLFAGLAAGTKYNAGLVLISPIVAHFAMTKIPDRVTRSKAASSLFLGALRFVCIPIFAAVGFLIGTPGFLINHEAFMRDFTYEMHHASTGHGLVFVGTGSGWIYHIIHSLLPGLGLPLLILTAIGILYALWKRSPADIAMLVFFIIYYAIIGSAQVRFARYMLPLLPILMVMAARAFVGIWSLGVGQSKQPLSPAVRILKSAVLTIIMLLVICHALLYSVALDRTFVLPDTRDRAAAWVKETIPHGDSIGLATIPWFYTPPLDPTIAAPIVAQARYNNALEFTDYRLAVSGFPEWNAEYLETSKPDYVMLSQFEYEDRIRLKKRDTMKYLDVLDRDYVLDQRFEVHPTVYGFKIPLMPKLPHDMSYVSPTILIYSRKADGASHG